jgi:hypothetical protein
MNNKQNPCRSRRSKRGYPGSATSDTMMAPFNEHGKLKK